MSLRTTISSRRLAYTTGPGRVVAASTDDESSTMRRFLLLAAAAATGAHAQQLIEFSSHIILTGFDVENFNRPNRLAHIELFGCLVPRPVGRF